MDTDLLLNDIALMPSIMESHAHLVAMTKEEREYLLGVFQESRRTAVKNFLNAESVHHKQFYYNLLTSQDALCQKLGFQIVFRKHSSDLSRTCA